MSPVFISVLLVVACHGYPDGAPDTPEMCDTLKPTHYIIKENSSSGQWQPTALKPFNYSIHVNRKSVYPGKEVKIIIKADQMYFEGFILQARRASNTLDYSKKYGTFKPHDEDAKLICNDAAITHTKHFHWKNITFSWIAPQNVEENVKFVATVVKGYKTYFMNVESDVVKVSGTSAVGISTLILLLASAMNIVHLV
ncbi:putative defense protein Hdd11-like [Biomphalaria glabrata]|uniref:Defense protein Hdd11-like n=1 Tax=Biomphalaria glabrata TaxID=6526 RepID=A0A9W3AHR9_BIOGL|nr:putative defense protein Hdd11-like [Biomphalaria glabrata]